MDKWFKRGTLGLAGLALLYAIGLHDPFDTHNWDDYLRFRKPKERVPTKVIPKSPWVAKPTEENKLPPYHRVNYGENLSVIVKKYFNCEDAEELDYRVRRIQEFNFTEAEIRERDTNGDGLVDFILPGRRLYLEEDKNPRSIN